MAASESPQTQEPPSPTSQDLGHLDTPEKGNATSRTARPVSILGDLNETGAHASNRTADLQLRRPWSPTRILASLVDFLAASVAILFIIYGITVVVNEGRPAGDVTSVQLLRIAQYGPTVFPIAFAAVVAKFLRSTAAWRLERGAKLITLDQLLSSKTVLSAFTAPVTARRLTLLTLLLIPLWSLSPLGGQAALRVVFTRMAATVSPASIATVDLFLSPFTHLKGEDTGGLVPAINTLFASALISPEKSKAFSSDTFGNVKIPMLEALPGSKSETIWHSLVDVPDVVYSSITGLPLAGVPEKGVSAFTFETSYTSCDCEVRGVPANWTAPSTISGNFNITGDGFNYMHRMDTPSGPGIVQKINFVSMSANTVKANNTSTGQPIYTNATCELTTTFVELNVTCDGPQACRSTAIRPSQLDHDNPPCCTRYCPLPSDYWSQVHMNGTKLTVLDGWCDSNAGIDILWAFASAFDASTFCDTGHCSTSPIEAYLMDINRPFSQHPQGDGSGIGSSAIYTIGDEAFSQRLAQLINTFWIDSIAPYAVTGDPSGYTALSDMAVSGAPYTIVNVTGETVLETTILACSRPWLGVLLTASLVMLIAGLAGVAFSALTRGPDILDRFASLLRDNPYASGLDIASVEDAGDATRRLGDVRVRLGDVKPDKDRGHIALVASGLEDRPVGRLTYTRLYE